MFALWWLFAALLPSLLACAGLYVRYRKAQAGYRAGHPDQPAHQERLPGQA